MNIPRVKFVGKLSHRIKDTSFNQTKGGKGQCWHCDEEGHFKQNCPKRKKDMKEKGEKMEVETSHANQSVSWSSWH